MKNYWINLPVNNIKKAVDFYLGIGFVLNTNYPMNENSASIVIGEQVFMIYQTALFEQIISAKVEHSNSGMLISVGVIAKEKVDSFCSKADILGGEIINEPRILGGTMYSGTIIDLDGHRWNALYIEDHN